MKSVLEAGVTFLFALVISAFIAVVDIALSWQFWIGMGLMWVMA